MKPYAEVIGDPIAQSRSPAIHGAWLAEAGIDAVYNATRVTPGDLADFVASRHDDPFWCGCSVTAPLKQAVIPFLDRLDPGADRIGAVNCIVPEGGKFVGYNTDVDGVLAALEGIDLDGRTAVMIGAGGAARAGLAALRQLGARVRIIARNAERASALGGDEVFDFHEAGAALTDAALVVNASTMGMTGADPMPVDLLAALDRAAPDAAVFDMVYHPEETALLRAARARGLATIGGLTMLEGQARRAFQLFFGGLTPSGDAA